MLGIYLYSLHKYFSAFNVFKYITFRSILATITALLVCLFCAPLIILWLRTKQIGQVIRDDGPPDHFSKEGTPTMGGLLILAGLIISTLLWMKPGLPMLIIMWVVLTFGAIGFVDDYLKVIKRNPKGLKARLKFFLQILAALPVVFFLYYCPEFNTRLVFPFIKWFRPDLGAFYIVFALLVIVGASNAVNLTDGLDGLAIGPTITTAGVYAVFAYVAGHSQFAHYLDVEYVKGAGELAVFCAALIGGGLGFLWYNAYPAQVFMGDVGSLPLGAAIGTAALLSKQELVLAIAGGIFVVEAVSVMVQVTSYKWKQKRVFRMAPIHHHFELIGWAEPKVTVRFWIISILLALAALSTLKLR